MATYAVIENGTVINVIVADSKEIAEQVLKVSNSMRQVAMSPIDTFANARKELKSGESIAKAKEQSATVQLDEKAVSEAKKIVFVSGGFGTNV